MRYVPPEFTPPPLADRPRPPRPGTAPAVSPARAPLRDPLPPVTTMLTALERARVDAAGEGLYRAMHRDSLDDVMRDLKERGASAVLVSVARCGAREAARVAAVVREFPRVTAVALLTQVEADTPHAVLTLGRSGVKTLVNGQTSRPTKHQISL